jgi:transcription elongation factor GreA
MWDMKRQYLSKKGYEQLKEKLEYLKYTERPRILQQIREAREKGDLRENAEYAAAREMQAILEQQISELEMLLAEAVVISEEEVDTSRVNLFCRVKVLNLQTNTVMEMKIVPSSESDPSKFHISVEAPLAKGLLGKMVGETCEVEVPAGKLKLKILEISL